MKSKLNELFHLYREYRNDGLSHNEALKHFSYLSPILFNSLVEFIENNYINGNIKEVK